MTLDEQRPAEGGMALARRAMIDSQLRVSGVNDPEILAAFAAVAREDFVPAERRAVAYVDRAVPLPGGATLVPALTHGQMLMAAEPVAQDTALVIGSNGYLAALLGHVAGSVQQADTLADASAGTVPEGGFSLILIDGAAEVLPDALAKLLADDGRLVTGVIERGVPRLAIARKVGGGVIPTILGETYFAPLPEFAAPKTWSF